MRRRLSSTAAARVGVVVFVLGFEIGFALYVSCFLIIKGQLTIPTEIYLLIYSVRYLNIHEIIYLC